MTPPDDRDLPCPDGDPCPTCGALRGEGHTLRCERADADDGRVPATCGPRDIDGDGCEVWP